MSEIAFSFSGEPFEVPSTATGWRVRRLRAKGAPEVVYSRDGVPLILPIEADIEDLRRAARSEGKFRLDAVDDHAKAVPNVPAGYVCIQAGDGWTDTTVSSRSPSDNAVIEAMRLNTELARSIIERFPMIMDGTAMILRAADGAGLPAREPRAIVATESDGDGDGDDDVDDRADDAPQPAKTGLMTLVELLLPAVMPMLTQALAGGKLQIPGGAAALLDCRRAAPKARVQSERRPTYDERTPVDVPAPGPRDPAQASGRAGGLRTSARRPAAPKPEPEPAVASGASVTAPAPEPAELVAGVAVEAPSPVIAHDGSPTERVTADVPAPVGDVDGDQADGPDHAEADLAPVIITESREELPILDSAALSHFANIQNALTSREGMLARAIAAELSPAELRSWITELRQLSTPDAVARIRGLLARIERGEDIGGVS